MNHGRVLHFGPYDGLEIDDIVEMDPGYIIEEAMHVSGHGISQAAINRAYEILDRREDDEEWRDENDFGIDVAIYSNLREYNE